MNKGHRLKKSIQCQIDHNEAQEAIVVISADSHRSDVRGIHGDVCPFFALWGMMLTEDEAPWT